MGSAEEDDMNFSRGWAVLRQMALKDGFVNWARGLAGLTALIFAFGLTVAHAADTGEKPLRIVAFGDSITAGYGLQPEDSLPVKLEAALKAKGYRVAVTNAGVSGDTTAGGLARLDWTLAEKPALVIVALGGNDGLRGLDPNKTRANLDALLAKLKARGVVVVLAGMLAPRNLGPEYAKVFDPIYADLAKKYDATLYPFLLEGVAVERALNQPDGIHPNPKGVAVIVERMAPVVAKAIDGLAPKPSGGG
jgi:acyl-CoA thioesterase-1